MRDNWEDQTGSRQFCRRRSGGPEAGGFAGDDRENRRTGSQRLCGFTGDNWKDQRTGGRVQAAWQCQRRLRRRPRTAAASAAVIIGDSGETLERLVDGDYVVLTYISVYSRGIHHNYL